jgi:hypothetical protein
VENGSIPTRSTKQFYSFLSLQIIANNPSISPQNARFLLVKDTGENSLRVEICC